MNLKIKLPVLGFCLTCLCSSCTVKVKQNQPAQYKGIQSLGWLSGSWQSADTAGGQYIEVWKASNDSTLSGKAWVAAASGPKFSETLSIEERENIVAYKATVSNQNEGKPVDFILLRQKDSTWVFENKQHDFPQRIIYTRPHPDSLVVHIEGEGTKGFRRETFRLLRKN